MSPNPLYIYPDYLWLWLDRVAVFGATKGNDFKLLDDLEGLEAVRITACL